MGVTANSYPDAYIQFDAIELIDDSGAVDLQAKLQEVIYDTTSGFAFNMPDYYNHYDLAVFWVKYPYSDNPKINVVDEKGNVLQEGVTGSLFNGTNTYKFEIYIDNDWPIDTQYIFKLYSDESPKVFIHSWRLLSPDEEPMTRSQGEEIITDVSNGWKIIT